MGFCETNHLDKPVDGDGLESVVDGSLDEDSCRIVHRFKSVVGQKLVAVETSGSDVGVMLAFECGSTFDVGFSGCEGSIQVRLHGASKEAWMEPKTESGNFTMQ